MEEIRKGSEIWNEVKELTRSGKAVMLSSVIVLTELWAENPMSKKDKMTTVEEMVEVVTFIDVNRKLAKLAGEIVRNYKVVGFDALIAASCMECEAELVTLNKKYFQGIKGLKLYK